MRAFLVRLRPLAPLVLRLMLATIFVYYGGREVLGKSAYLKHALIDESHYPRWLGYGAIWAELVGGVLIGVGFLTRLGGLALGVVSALILFKLKLHSGFAGGLDLPLLCLGASLSLVLSGAGRLSVDRRLFGGGE